MDLPFFTNSVYEPVQLTPEQLADLNDAGDDDRHILRTRPFKDGPGEEYAEEVISAFHKTVEEPGFLTRHLGDPDDPPQFSYEMWFDDGKLKFIWSVPDNFWYDESRRVITGEYPKIGIERMGKDHPTFTAESYISGGKLELKNHKYIPIKGTSGPGAFEAEKSPLRLISSEVTGQQDTSALVQVAFQPAPLNWRDGDGYFNPGASTLAKAYKQGNFEDSYINPKISDPTEQDLRIARALNNHDGDPAFYVTIRYFVFAPTKEIAQNHASSIGNAYRGTYKNSELNQGFTHTPLTDDDLVDELIDALNRDHDGSERPFTVPELAGIAHIPNDEVDTPNIDWTSKGLGSQAPSEAPRKPETIDARPYEQFGPEAAPEDNLTQSAPQLPPAEGHSPEEATEATAEADTSGDESMAKERKPGVYEYGRPLNQIRSEKQSDFKNVVEGIQLGELTYDDVRDQYSSEEEAENLIKLIKEEIKWREKSPGPDIPDDSQPEETDSGPPPQRAGHGIDSPQNLPVLEGDYDDYGFTPAESRREWMLDPNTGEDRAYEIRVRKENENGQDDWYMGRDVRNELFDIHDEHPDSPIWLGWLKDNRVGVREIGIEQNAWYRHMTIFGMTGTGKSTFQNNIMNQIARKGYGFCYIDPKGDTVADLIRQLPEDRLDDVVWIEPGSIKHDKVVGINFLEPAYGKDHPNFDREVTSIVDDLTAILKGGDYWGPKMEGITTNIARAMIRSDINYTLLDMYYVLLSEEARQSFADMVKQEGEEKRTSGEDDDFVDDMENIHTYTQQIAEMDYEEVDAVVRRIQHWIEDPIARGIVAHREGTVNITDAVEEGKIILVNINIDSADIKEVVSTAIMRRIWAAIKARDEDEHERTPYFSFIDEFDDVAAPEMDIEKMLSKARSGKMGVGLACQNPSQIPEAPRKQMFANARTLNSFGVGEPDDAGLISTRFGEDVETEQVMEIPQFTVYTRVLLNTEDGPQLSDPLPINTFADYPPLRDHEETHEVIEQSLEKYGVEPLEETLEESAMILYDMGNSITIQRALLQSIWEVQIRRDTEYVALHAVDEVFKKRTGHSVLEYPEGVTIDPEWATIYHPKDDETDVDDLVEEVNGTPTDGGDAETSVADGGYVEAQPNSTGEIVLSQLDGVVAVTDAGKEEVLSSDRHRAQPTDTHRELLNRGVFEWFTRLGFTVNILKQSGSHTDPDAEGFLPVKSETESLAVAQSSWEELEQEYPLLAELSNGREVTFEAEVSLRKPAGPLRNIARASNNNRRPVFIVPDGRREDLMPSGVSDRGFDYWADRLNRILSEPPMVRKFNVYEDDNGTTRTARVLYNTQEYLSLTDDPREEKFPLIRKGGRCVWEEHDGALLRLYDAEGDDGKQRGKITPDDLQNASANAFDTWCRYDKYEDEWVVYPDQSSNIRYDELEELKEDWQRVYKPFHPDTEIDGDPEGVDPLITILRDEEYVDSLEDAMPAIYHPNGGENASEDAESTIEPLIPEDQRQLWDSDLIPGYNPIEDTPEFLQEDSRPLKERLEETYETKKIMAENIDTDKAIGSTDIPERDYDPHHEPDYDFGGKEPTTRAFWEKVWTKQDRDLENPLEIDPLREGLTNVAMPADDHEEAVKAAIETGHLIPSDIGYFLARPHQRPKVILDEYDQYDDRNIWANIWRINEVDTSQPLPRQLLEVSSLNIPPFTDEKNDEAIVTAAVELALSRGALQTTDDDKIELPPAGIPEKWKRAWERTGTELDEPTDRHFLKMALRGTEDLEDLDDAETHVQNALDQNTLYETDGGIRINDPETSEGPPLTPESDEDSEDDDSDDDPDGTGESGDDGPDTGDEGESESGSDGTPADEANEDTEADEQSDATEDAEETTEATDTGEASGEADTAASDQSPPERVTLNEEFSPDDMTPVPGTDRTVVEETAGGEKPPEDYEQAELWDITPTDEAPEGWKDAFAAVIDTYHSHLDTEIQENKWWNNLVDDHRDRRHTEAVCEDHDHYVAGCPDCVVTGHCAECDDDTPLPIARVEWESCGAQARKGKHDAIPRNDCPNCVERVYCPEHAPDRPGSDREWDDGNGDTEGDTIEEDFDPAAPITYVEFVTCYNCEAYEEHADVAGKDCKCDTRTHEGPLHRLPETPREYFTGPDWSHDGDLSGAELAANHTPNRHRGDTPDTVGRGWDNDIVEDRKLGWVPGTKPFEHPVAETLLNKGYTVQQLLATGLFRPDPSEIKKAYSETDDDVDEDGIAELDLEADLADGDHPLEPADVVQAAWSGRPVFPAFNEDGEPVYAYARQQNGRRHPDDYRSDAKYLKLSVDAAYVYAYEPIYGADTLIDEKATIITEGVADAIAAHSHGLACLSPVTTQFKDKHHGPLLRLLREHDISSVVMIQDNEPGSFAPLDEASYDVEEVAGMNASRRHWVDSDSQDLSEHISERNGPGPIGKAMEIDGVGPGLSGALATADFLEQNGVTAIQVDLPRFGGEKVDLDDYLTSGLHEYAPPVVGLQTLRWCLDADEEAALVQQLVEASAFTHYYERNAEGYLTDDEGKEISTGLTANEDLDHDYPSYEQLLGWHGTRREMREGILPAAQPGEADDYTLEAVEKADGPETFNKRLLGLFLGLGTPVRAVPELSEAPRTPQYAIDSDAVFPSGETPAAADAADSGHTAAENDAGVVGYTPLFSGPEMYTATEHPKYETVLANRASYAKADSTEDDYDPAAAENPSNTGSATKMNELYQLTLRDVTGLSSGFRGKNPQAHVGNSEDYFVMLSDEAAYDHKRKALYNALTYMAVEAGPRDISSPSGTFDDEEILETWVHAKEQGYISSDAQVPIRALNEAAVDMGVADYSDIGPVEVGYGDDAFVINNALPAEQYNAAIDGFKSEFGVIPGRPKLTVESDFINPEITTENSLEKFGELFLDDDPEVGDDYPLDAPRVSTNPCWQAYLKWCDINDIEPKNRQQIGGLVSNIDGEKKRAKIIVDDDGTVSENSRSSFEGVVPTSGGWWLYKNQKDGQESGE
jgi:hypothetical protein